MQLSARLRLYDDPRVHNEVEPLYSQLAPLGHNLHQHFPSYRVPSATELSIQSSNVEMFEKPVSECVVDLEERTNDGVRESFLD